MNPPHSFGALLGLTVFTLACGGPPASSTVAGAPRASVPLGVVGGHFHTLPVRVNGEDTRAILDTGIGLALVSRALCDRLGCEVEGEFAGRRMSGQLVHIPLTTLDRLEIGGVARENLTAGVIDIEGFFPDPRIEAFVGLPFFEHTPFTLDPDAGTLTIESAASVAVREARGQALPVRLDRQGPAIDIFVPMELGDGTVAEVMMDTGSPGVTLHTRYADVVSVDLQGDAVRRREGQDETGHSYVRYFTTLESPLRFAGAPCLRRAGLRTMFQEIIHDGLVGVELLSSFVITYDVAGERVIVAPRTDGPL